MSITPLSSSSSFGAIPEQAASPRGVRKPISGLEIQVNHLNVTLRNAEIIQIVSEAIEECSPSSPEDDKIISMDAKKMSTRDIQAHIQEIYGAEISPTGVSNITEKVVEVAKEWQCRPLHSIYAIAYL